MAKRALITGITGQDGSYLAEWLLEQGYDVHGIVRRVALEDPLHRMWRIVHLKDALQLHVADLEHYPSILRLLQQVRPDEVYHLAAHSFVGHSLEEEHSTLHTNITTTHTLLSAFREACPSARFYFAGSSEMFGKATEAPQRETTPFAPRSAYGISKCAGLYLTRTYRERFGLFAAAGILFNHESPRRGFEFVTRKISSHVALIAAGKLRTLTLGNLDARRDWGHAQRYVQAVWAILQAPAPDDYVIATGQTHSVREFCEIAFGIAGLDYRDHVQTDPALYRPGEEAQLVGDASKAKAKLGWTYQVSFEELVREMVEHDLERVRHDAGELLAAGAWGRSKGLAS